MSGAGCRSSLGVSSGDIKDNQMTASSSFSVSSVGAENGRLGTERGGGAWCPAQLISEQSSEEWLEVDLGQETVVTGVITQGRYAGGTGEEYAELVSIKVWSALEQTWDTVAEAVTANRDTYSKVEILLEESVVTRRVRLVPVSEHPRMVCLRVELLGCHPDTADTTTSTTTTTATTATTVERKRPENKVMNHQKIVEKQADMEELIEIEKEMKAVVERGEVLDSFKNETKNSEVVSVDNSEGQYMMVSVIVLVSIIVILIITIIFILYKNYQFTHSKTIIRSDSDLAESSYPLYQARTIDSNHQVYTNSVQSTPYKQQQQQQQHYHQPQQSPYNNFKYYPAHTTPPLNTSSSHYQPPTTGSGSHYSNYYATTDLIQWHNRKYLNSPSHGSVLGRSRPGPVDL